MTFPYEDLPYDSLDDEEEQQEEENLLEDFEKQLFNNNDDNEEEEDYEEFEESSEEEEYADASASFDQEQVQDTDTKENSDSAQSDNKNVQKSKIFSKEITVDGKTFTVENEDEVLKLMELGVKYAQEQNTLKQHESTIATLKTNDLLDPDKLNFAIDLLNKNPAAIAKLLADSDINPFDIDTDKQSDYTPKNYQVSREKLTFDRAIDNIKNTPTYSKTIDIFSNQWDLDSRNSLIKDPALIEYINEHVALGIYDKISTEVTKRKIFGKLPNLSDIELYNMVGDEMFKKGEFARNNKNKRVTNPAIKEAKIKATSTRRTVNNDSSRFQQEDVFALSDEEFLKKYGKKY